MDEKTENIPLTKREACILSFSLGVLTGQGVVPMEESKKLAQKLSEPDWDP